MHAILSILGLLADSSSVPFAIFLLVRWTVLLALAWLVHGAIARCNPRWRVAFWRAVIVGIVLIPVLASAPPVVTLQRPGVARSVVIQSGETAGPVANAADVERLVSGPPRPERAPAVTHGTAAPGAMPAPFISKGSLTSSRPSPGTWLLGIWAAGVVILAVRHACQVWRLTVLIGRSERVAECVVAGWGGLPAIDVRTSAEIPSPCLARSWRPVLLLPETMAVEHDPVEMRAILAHEMAHAQNRDLAWNDALHLVSIFLWFHPLAWRVCRAHAVACDAVCDALAADSLGDVGCYSRVLARLALRAAGTPAAGVLAMARVADVRRRIESLNRRVFRLPLPRKLTVPAMLAFGFCVVVIGGLGFTRAEPAQARATVQKKPASAVVLHVIDPSGKPVKNAQVEIREMDRWPKPEPGRTDAQGHYKAVGLKPGQITILDITADNPPLGATVEVEAEQGGGSGKTVEVRLQPLVSLSGRVLDEEGQPIAGPTIQLYRVVMYPGQSHRSFGLPIATSSNVKADGSYTFDGLIPGATYNTQVEADGHATATSRQVIVKPGQPVRLDDFRLPITDQEIRGIVVDLRGKPISGVTVNYDRRDTARALYAPSGATWFQDTDPSGRFHLTGLPRGPIRLMAYRRPEGAYRSIQNMKRLDVQPGQTEVRIELPDPNDRLRGID